MICWFWWWIIFQHIQVETFGSVDSERSVDSQLPVFFSASGPLASFRDLVKKTTKMYGKIHLHQFWFQLILYQDSNQFHNDYIHVLSFGKSPKKSCPKGSPTIKRIARTSAAQGALWMFQLKKPHESRIKTSSHINPPKSTSKKSVVFYTQLDLFTSVL